MFLRTGVSAMIEARGTTSHHDSLSPRTRSTGTYAFGPFRLDPSRRLLTCGDETIPLPERTFQLLLILIQAGGTIVDKETLAVRVWPDSTVSDGNLSQHIYMLRQILGERARDRAYIITVSGKGYRFAAPVFATPAAQPPVAAEHTASPGSQLLDSGLEVFRHYCRGSQLLERRTAPCLWEAIDAFDAAARLDAKYVPALIGLARAYALLAEFWNVAGEQVFPKAREAVRRALALDPKSAAAHSALSEILLFCDWNWNAALREIDTAIWLNPGSTFVCNNAAWLHICRGAYDEALSEVQRALTMEPSSPHLQLLFARVLVHSGEYDQAILSLSNLVEADGSFYISRRYRAQAYLLQGQPEPAIGDLLLLRAQEQSEDPSFRLPMLGRAYADCGDKRRAQDIHKSLVAMAASSYVVCWNLALSAIGIGKNEEAMTWLERAYEEREPTLLFLKSLPWFKPIAAEPRFKDLLEKIGP